MRTIKFRAWDITHERIDEVWSVDTRLGLVETEKWKLSLNNPKDCELMQFTGLLDKNGKEIYEGDILRAYRMQRKRRLPFEKIELIFEVVFDKKKAAFKIYYPEMGWSSLFGLDEPYEIIGNIYENPELLTPNPSL